MRIAFSGCNLNNHSTAPQQATGQACCLPRVPDQATDLFHIDALSAVVPLKINGDLRCSVKAAMLYRPRADRIGHGQQHQAPRSQFREFFDATTDLSIDEYGITVTSGPRVNSPFLGQQGCAGERCWIPLLGNRMLRLAFGQNDRRSVTAESVVRIEAAGIAERRLELVLEVLGGSTVPGWISPTATNGGGRATWRSQPTPQQLKEDTKCV